MMNDTRTLSSESESLVLEPWPQESIYRVFLKGPYPSAVIKPDVSFVLRLGMVNEMSLLNKAALGDIEARIEVDALDIKTFQVVDVGLKVDALTETQQRWHDLEGLGWAGYKGGQGACAMTINGSSEDFLLRVRLARGFVEDKIHVIPLIFGPFKVADEEARGNEVFRFYRPLLCGDGQVIVQEFPDIAIPGKIWDSALFSGSAVAKLLQTGDERVLDLSTGTGVCGIYLKQALFEMRCQAPQIVLTDVREALSTIKQNLELMQDPGTLKVQELLWDDSNAIEAIGTVDFIIACDLIYEADLLPALVNTLVRLSTAQTRVLIGYKQRGLSIAEKQQVWGSFAKHFKVEHLNLQRPDCCISNVLGHVMHADTFGIELWLLTRSMS